MCVTCAGAGTAKPSTEKKAEAEKTLEKRGDSPASSARFVRCGDWIRTRPLYILHEALADEPEHDLTFHETRAARSLGQTFTTVLDN